jgi:hypothetical protein
MHWAIVLGWGGAFSGVGGVGSNRFIFTYAYRNDEGDD